MRESYLKTIFIILISILLLIAIYICVFKNKEKTMETSKLKTNTKDILIANDIRIGIIGLDTINPILSNNKNIQDISRLIFDPLFTLTQDYKTQGVLAKECSKIDKKTYIIKLNENITWHDNKKFDSSDVIFTINMLKKLGQDSIYYYNIKNIVQLKAIDEYTIKIVTDSDIQYFEYNLIFPIISSKYYDESNLKSNSKNIKPVGTGMFYISEVNNDTILLKKNSINENIKDIRIDMITIKKYSSLSDTIKAFKSEEIDMFTTSNKNIEEYLKNSKYNIKEYINRNYNYIALNCDSEILSNKEVRQAINYAIDKNELSRNVFNNKCQISNFPLDFGSYVYDINNDSVAYDANIAKNLLNDNGWKYSEEGWKKKINNANLKIELDIIVNMNNTNNVKIAKNIKQQLKNVGIVLDIKEENDIEYNKYLKNKNYDMIILESTYGYSPSIEKYFGENNQANYNNKEIDTLLNETNLINNDNEIQQKYTRIVEIYNEEVLYISLYYNTNILIYSRNLRGTINPNSYNLFYGLESWYREYEK